MTRGRCAALLLWCSRARHGCGRNGIRRKPLSLQEPVQLKSSKTKVIDTRPDRFGLRCRNAFILGRETGILHFVANTG